MVKVAGFPLLGCWVTLNRKIHNFQPILDEEQLLTKSKSANRFISAVVFNYLWTWNIYAKYGNKLLLLP